MKPAKKAVSTALYTILLLIVCSSEDNPYLNPDVLSTLIVEDGQEKRDTTSSADTVFRDVFDTLIVIDTVRLVSNDTQTVYVYDTLVVYQRDTVVITRRDTVLIHSEENADGRVLAEFFDSVIGFRVQDLTQHHIFPHNPSRTEELEELSVRGVGRVNYGTRLRGYLHPPRSGDYRFHLVSDDQGQVWLSTDHTEEEKRLIVQERRWRSIDRWYGAPSSSSIYLRAGNRYYIEILHKQALLSGHIEVGWTGPDNLDEKPIPATHLSIYIRE